MNEKIDVSGSKFDVEDITKYDYLKPIWEMIDGSIRQYYGIISNKLENSPDQGITSKELWDKSELDPEKGNKLIKELQIEFQNKVLSNIMNLFIHKKQIANSWAFDKVMLMVTKINTGSDVGLPDNMIFNMWKREWRKKRGI